MEATKQQLFAQTRNSLGLSIDVCADLQELLSFLPNCEWDLISFMVDQKAWKGTVPNKPSNYDALKSSVDFGLFPYWINNPKLITDVTLRNYILGLKPWESILLKVLVPTSMNATNYAVLTNLAAPLVYYDGSIISTLTYATYDQGWFTAFFNMAKTLMNGWWYNNRVFPMPTKPTPIGLSGANANKVTIAMLGDWGSGDPNAVALIKQVQSMSPDYIIHVGDVYYAGTPVSTDPNGAAYISPGQEKANLMDLWPLTDTKGKSYVGRSFTLNSNHEMYSGGTGLFLDALHATANPAGSGSVFSAQKGMSCFVLSFGGWNILGLDSAFNASVTNAFMLGSLDGPIPVQTQWIKQLHLQPQKTIVLTHHNGFAFDCSSSYSLWDDVKNALGNDPFAWYWGHVHSGIVYADNVKIPVSTNQPTAFSTKTFARCLGHSGLPYGYASALTGNSNVAWQVAQNTTPVPKGLLPNGYVILTLETDQKGNLNKITEAFYDTNNGTKPTFTKVIFNV